jgi:MFS family permease
MLAVLRRRNYALLWSGQLVSMIGDWMLFVALPMHVYTISGSALLTGLTFAVQMLPTIVLGSLAGVFVDRWDRAAR